MSKPPRFFITPDQVRDPYITIVDDDVRHIRMVLRKEPGDLLTLLDGQGKEYTVRITAVEKAEIDTEIIDRRERRPASPAVVLGQGIVKVRDEEKRVGRWQKICREAAMQSDRPDIPQVRPIASFDAFIRTLAPG